MQKEICRCVGYGWPHRRASKNCIYRPGRGQLCAACGKPCNAAVARRQDPLGECSTSVEVMSVCCGDAVVLDGEHLTPAELAKRRIHFVDNVMDE